MLSKKVCFIKHLKEKSVDGYIEKTAPQDYRKTSERMHWNLLFSRQLMGLASAPVYGRIYEYLKRNKHELSALIQEKAS